MIYIKNTTETQTIFIPRNELQKEAYITSTKTYEDGYREGLEDGKEYQKDQLLNLYVTENGQYEREDGWGTVTVDIPIGDCPECEECPECEDCSGAYDEGYNQGYEDGQNSVECPECDTCNLGEGSILLDTSMVGTYELYASDDGYDGWSKFIVNLEGGEAIKVHKASDLLDTFNNGEQIDFGRYYYVGGEITDIQDVNTQYGNATYTLDNGFSVYRGKWMDGNPFGEDQIKVGAYIVVYGVIADYRGTLQFNAGSQVIAYQECEGGEIVSCNLEDKWLTPSMGDRDDNGYVIANPSEGFDGLSRVVIDPTTIYNEGVSAGKAEGGDLNIGTGDIFLTANERGQRFEIFPSEFEYDAFDKFIVEMENFDLGDDANIYLSNEFVTMFWDGKLTIGKTYIVKGQISDIQRIRPEYGDARYTLDGGFNIYNGQTMGYDLQIFDWVIVSGILSEYDGGPQFSAGSEIKALWREGGSGNCDDAYNSGYNQGYNDGQANCEGGSCNLEDKGVTPSMSDRDGNGLIVVEESEGFDGLSRVVIDPTTIYNEGYTDGYNEGSNQLSNNVLEGDMVLSFQLNDNNFPDLRNDGKGIFTWDSFQVPLYIKRPNGCGELYLSGNYDDNSVPSLHSKFFQDDDYAKIEKLTINFWRLIPNNIVNVVNLKELHLGENVEIIDKNAFQDVSNLKTIYCYYDNPGIYMYTHKESFVGLPNNGTLYVKKSAQPPWGWIEDLGWTIVNI
jgi:hypothetical protein